MRGCPDPNLERRSKSDCALRSRLIGRDVHLLISPAIPVTLQWGINGRLMAGKRKSCREHGFALPPDTILSGMNGPPLMDGVNSLRVNFNDCERDASHFNGLASNQLWSSLGYILF
ncbi:hypothetical protein AVEN_141383-1 [Araneus ventricosus]|uniref:Uncharacterized protein n=1 Tax=Araneus ventricosus TaxID=182803 RepID=A0A4Y2D015_ARAVE|nr:hypothetical protein AVEN_141383-1 [Araneus ventricosus]